MLADIPGYVEDGEKRNDFTIVDIRHHTKLFLPAHLVVRDHSHEVTEHLVGIWV